MSHSQKELDQARFRALTRIIANQGVSALSDEESKWWNQKRRQLNMIKEDDHHLPNDSIAE